MTNKINKIVIATGGTGGHIFPAYSLAKHFIEKDIIVELISDKRGLKYLEGCEGVKITTIESSTIFNKNIFKTFASIITILYSIYKSFFILLKNRPNLVFGMGGYSSFPICIVAKMLRIPFIIYESNLHIGKVNRFLLPFTMKAFVSNKYLEGIPKKYKNKICKIGNIIRKEILNFEKNKHENYNKDEKIKILILGGSQAAKVFGEKLPKIFKECHDSKIPIKIYQQCLPDQVDHLNSFYRKSNLQFEVFNFSENILDYFSKINLAITRSGASILAELINVKIPFISIPLPSSTDNHQLKNAIYYEKNQFSYLVEEKCLGDKLFKLIKLIHKDRSLLDQMKSKQKQYSDKSVYNNIDIEMGKIINEEY